MKESYMEGNYEATQTQIFGVMTNTILGVILTYY